jgi:hypothetical protein
MRLNDNKLQVSFAKKHAVMDEASVSATLGFFVTASGAWEEFASDTSDAQVSSKAYRSRRPLRVG